MKLDLSFDVRDLFYWNTASLVDRVMNEGLPIGLQRYYQAAAIDNRNNVLMKTLDKCT